MTSSTGQPTSHKEWVGNLPCCICRRRPTNGKNDAHHTKTVGAGGTERDLIPLCRLHHSQFHQMGRWSFQAWAGFDLAELAAALWENSPFKTENPPPLESDDGSLERG